MAVNGVTGTSGVAAPNPMTGVQEMAEVVLFHHVQGLTEGVLAFADALRTAGHTVHTPDLFDGERPP